ncbi:hypothetical protein Lpp223_1032 [Lacticaseibacillus paracasei subsp. paracasei Lpp223]|nr:hypothetical protein Lpp223_1032 [Lacticaseibacillus paracasei subsp. paracasei Lpp223]
MKDLWIQYDMVHERLPIQAPRILRCFLVATEQSCGDVLT